MTWSNVSTVPATTNAITTAICVLAPGESGGGGDGSGGGGEGGGEGEGGGGEGGGRNGGGLAGPTQNSQLLRHRLRIARYVPHSSLLPNVDLHPSGFTVLLA